MPRKRRVLDYLRKAEEEMVEMIENGEMEDKEKQEIKSRVDALDARVRVLEHRPLK